ncbi:TPR repeat-containing protein YfgC precursor [compost metagenome]
MRARVQLIFEESPGIAAKRFRAMLEDNPKLDAARYGLALAQIRVGQLNEAGENLKPLLAKAPNDIAYNLAQADLDITANRLKEADARVTRLLAQYPGSYPLRQAHADLLMKQNRAQDAEKVLAELSQKRPLDPDVWSRLADARTISGNAIGVHQARAEYYALTGDYRQAIEQLDFAKRRAGGNFQLAARLDARQQEFREQERLLQQMMRG